MLESLKKYPYPIIFFAYFLVNIAILNNLPFGIDYQYWLIDVKSIKNPLLSWFPWSNYYKSWPLTYNILWVYLKIFGDSVVYLRFLNLLLHFLNFVLLKKVASHYISSPSKLWLVSLLFLFSPLSVLTISWAFQIKTLLGFFFILICTYLSISKTINFKNALLIILTFYLSLTAKVLAILFPFFFLFHHRKKLKTKSVASLSIILLLLSLIQGLLNLKGVTYFKNELKQIQKAHFTSDRDVEFKMSELPSDDRTTIDRSTNRPVKKIFNEISVGSTEYLSSFSSTERLRDKHIIATQNLGRLFLSSLGLYNSLPFYEDPSDLLNSETIYLYSLIGVILFAIIIISKDDLLLFAYLLFFPIAGYIYVPYMKFSYTSDHWFYAASGILIIALGNKIKSPLFWTGATLSILSSLAFNQFKYSSFEGLLIYNFKENKNKVALQTSLYYDKIKGFDREVLQKSKYILDEVDFYSQSQYYNMINAANRLGFSNFPKSYYSRIARKRLRNENELLLDQFLFSSRFFLTKKDIVLTKALTAVNKNYLSDEQYNDVINFLSQED